MKLDKFRTVFAVSIILVFIFAVVTYGVIPNQYDNLFYLNSARNLFFLGKYINGFNLIDPQWPIFYSLSILPAFLLNIPEHMFARVLNLGYFFGGIYFFYQFLKLKNIDKNINKLCIIFSLVNYYTIRSVILEMPDITFYFYFNCFLFLVESVNHKKVQSVVLIGLLSFLAVITKPTGSVFFLACVAGLILNFLHYKKLEINTFLITTSAVFGMVFGKILNKFIISREEAGGSLLHLQHLHVDGGFQNSKEMIISMLEQFISFDLFKEKVIFLSNWFIPSDVFKQFQFIPFLIGLILIFIFIKKNFEEVFKNGNFSKISVSLLIIYFVLCLTPAPVIQKRHVIPMIPFLYFIFIFSILKIEKIKSNKWLKNLIIGSVIIGNIVPVVLFLLIGNMKDHGGIYHQIVHKTFYQSKFIDILDVARWTRDYKEKTIFVPIKLVRFFSYQRNGQVTQLLNGQKFQKGNFIVRYRKGLDQINLTNMSSVYTNPTFEVFEITD